jgi:hypothetical protein
MDKVSATEILDNIQLPWTKLQQKITLSIITKTEFLLEQNNDHRISI